MNNPADRLYSEEHIWVKINGAVATLGLTPYAQDALGEIVFIDLPEIGTTVIRDQPLGEIESTKSVSDLYSPVDGVVTERNEAVKAGVHLLNEDVWGAWLVRVDLAANASTDHLLDAERYTEMTEA
ncbi:glycine cleavage system protein GcvH [Stomatohabitans albus]|uniref:glycine cleavage system protein GcvH n=1 Tax=Stomatohabitans albus TaxID=3110766 RepID=UPI00300D8071